MIARLCVHFINRNIIKRKYKFVNDIKISEFSAVNVSVVLKNKKIENNTITRNREFEQIEQIEQTTIVQQNKKNIFRQC